MPSCCYLIFFLFLSVLQLCFLQGGTTQTVINLSGNQTVLEGSNVTFSCTIVETVDNVPMQLRSIWFIIFSDSTQTNIRLQGGKYTPADTDQSLFYVPDIYPGFQESFTFVSISHEFNMVEVRCFNGEFMNSSFITFYEPFKFGNDTIISRREYTTGFFPVNIDAVGDDVEINYEWTRNGVVLSPNDRVQYLINGINFTDGQGGMYRNDSGIYRLNISNIAGSTVTYLTLDVQYAPSITGSEVQQELAFQIGLDEIVTCGLNSSHEPFLDGNPFPHTSWQFDGTLIMNVSKYEVLNSSLLILNVERDDTGIYNCTATNSLGSEVISFSIEVFDVASSPQNVTVNFITNTTAVISWETPSFTDGLLVCGYIVLDYGTGMELGRTEDNVTSITIRSLLPAINHSVVVLAVTCHRFGRVAKGNTSDVVDFTTEMGWPVLGDMVTKAIDDDITISWTVITNGGMPIIGYTVEWIVPGTSTYTQAPNGRIDDENITYLRISFGDVLAREEYHYRIKAMNSLGRESNYLVIAVSSPKGLPASPSKPQVSTDIGGVVNVSTRTDVAGVDTTNTTLIFEIDAQSSFETITRNFTVVMYRISNEVRFTFSGLRAEQNYTFRCRVFNIYGASDYSINSTQIIVNGGTVTTSSNDNDDENSNTVAIIGAIAGGAILLILVLLIIIITTYALVHHKRNAATYKVNDDDDKSGKEPAFIIQYGDNPQYSQVEIQKPLNNMYASDATAKLPSVNGNSYEQIKSVGNGGSNHNPVSIRINNFAAQTHLASKSSSTMV
ncbi:netrin receptor DCC-like isoform X2 [Dysidea avara]|uniref:netrin receptor DCC-like isoform X2 n=1 Tax=Dysidea avara TaxID=196820 RepID=UPI00331AF6DA